MVTKLRSHKRNGMHRYINRFWVVVGEKSMRFLDEKFKRILESVKGVSFHMLCMYKLVSISLLIFYSIWMNVLYMHISVYVWK
jgi:hypothetical protein